MATILLAAMIISFSVSAYGSVLSASRSGARSEDVATPSLDIAYQNLSFRDNVVIKYAVKLENVDSAQLLVWTKPQSEYVYGTHEKALETVGTQVIKGGEYHVYDYTELSAKQMTDEIYARAYANIDGKAVYSQVKKYSILEYALRVTGKIGHGKDLSDDPTLISMVEQMLEYGTAAQKHFKYNLDRLANAEYGEVIAKNCVIGDGDGFESGIYPVNSIVEISAAGKDDKDTQFSHWVDYYGKKLLSSNEGFSLRVSEGTTEYAPVYSDTKVDYFYTDEMVAQLKTYLSSDTSLFSYYVDGVAPFMLKDTSFVSGGRVRSMGIAIGKTGAADVNGNFTLTLFVVGSSATGMKRAPLRSYTILVNGAEHGLTSNNNSQFKWIDVDLTSYGIVLKDDESLALYQGGDTLIPVYSNNATVKNYISGKDADCLGFYMNAGKSNCSAGNHALIVNLGIEHFDDVSSPFIYENSYSADVVSAVRALTASNPGGFKPYSTGVGKFSPLAHDFISDGKLISLGFPVYSVSTPDENGNYSFTVSVFDKNGLGGASLRDYKILVNKNDYDLSSLNWIEVDVSGYDIILAKNETIALCGTNDTLLPAYTNSTAVTGALPSDFVGFYMNVGKSNYSSNATSALVLDIRMARENPAYDEKVTEALYNDALVNTIKGYMTSDTSKFSSYGIGGGPYVMQAEEFISDGRVLSIGMPVTTDQNDTDGNYQFTIYVHGKDFNTGIKAAPRRSYQISVSGSKYGLSAGCAMKWIDLDLSEYDIVLGKDETLAFSSAATDTKDTLIPYYTKDLAIKEAIDSNADNATGFMSKPGTSSPTIGNHALLLNIRMERNYTYDSMYVRDLDEAQREYDAMISALKSKYAGKKISIIGDSISTFGGYSNNASNNSTTGSNAVYYNTNSNISTVDQTYWMKLIDALDMELCVNNSWSGGRVYGKNETSYKDSSVFRSTQLHRDANGTRVDPDVILFFYGINDINNKVAFGNLLEQLDGANNRNEELEIVDAWFKALLAKNANGSVAGSTYNSFQEAYALSLYNMKTNYANAEIYCVNLIPCEKYLNNNGGTYEVMENYNYFYELMVDYFDLALVDQYSELSENYYSFAPYYTNAADLLHPNAGGHTKFAKRIIKAMAKKNGII